MREGLAEEKKRISLSSIKLEEDSKKPEYPLKEKKLSGGSEEPCLNAVSDLEEIKEEINV